MWKLILLQQSCGDCPQELIKDSLNALPCVFGGVKVALLSMRPQNCNSFAYVEANAVESGLYFMFSTVVFV